MTQDFTEQVIILTVIALLIYGVGLLLTFPLTLALAGSQWTARTVAGLTWALMLFFLWPVLANPFAGLALFLLAPAALGRTVGWLGHRPGP